MLALLAAAILALPALAGLAWLWWRRPLWLLGAYLLLMPFHTLSFRVIGVELGLAPGVQLILQSWKDLLLLALVVRAAMPALLTGRLRMAHPWVLPLLGLYLAVGAWGVLNSPSTIAGLYGFRGTFQPLALLLLALLLPADAAWLRRLAAGMLVIGCVVAAFAIFQALVLGYPFLLRYYAVDGRIANSFSFLGGSFQRAMGTFSSPNQFSLYLSFLIVLGVNLALRLPAYRWPTLMAVGLLAAALILTVSRSGWVACAAGLAVSGLLWRRKSHLLVPLALLALVAVPSGLALGLDRHLTNTISLQDTSAVYRIGLTQSNVETILSNPLGVGLGIVGARAQRTLIVGDDALLYRTESYLLQTGMELGIPGLLLFLALLFATAWTVYTNIFRLRAPAWRALAVAGVACAAAALGHSLFIADLQELTVGSYLWFLLGVGMRLPAIEAAAAPRPAAAPAPLPAGAALPAR